jgi:hypothetical protein
VASPVDPGLVHAAKMADAVGSASAVPPALRMKDRRSIFR